MNNPLAGFVESPILEQMFSYNEDASWKINSWLDPSDGSFIYLVYKATISFFLGHHSSPDIILPQTSFLSKHHFPLEK